MRTRRLRAALLAALCLVAPGSLRAQAAEPGLRDLTQLVVSERLRTFALARGLAAGGPELGTALDLKQLLQRQGFYIDRPGWQRIAAEQALYPQLSYVPNLNGGATQERLEFQGLTFYLREDLLARGGLAAGASYDGLVRWGWDAGRHVEVRGQIGGLHAPGPDLTAITGTLAVCSRNHLSGWRFADLCVSHSQDHRALQDVVRDEAVATFGTLFERGLTRHALDLSLAHRQTGETDRNLATLGLDSGWQRSATRLSLELGAPAGAESGPAVAAAGEIRWRLADRVLGVGLSLSRSPDTMFLGEPRRDHGLGLTGLVAVTDDLVLTASYLRNRSTIDFFDDRQISVGFSYRFP
jgi:hypothetical protein